MTNHTQIAMIEQKLRQENKISRNYCLSNYISRLGAIICTLKKRGWEFKGEYKKAGKGKDYIYTATKIPQLQINE